MDLYTTKSSKMHMSHTRKSSRKPREEGKSGKTKCFVQLKIVSTNIKKNSLAKDQKRVLISKFPKRVAIGFILAFYSMSNDSPLGVHWQSAGCLLVVCWESAGSLQVYWEFTGSPMQFFDFQKSLSKLGPTMEDFNSS